MSQVEVPALRTGPGSRAEWYPGRYSALVDGLIAKGLDVASAQRVGLMLLPLLARETGHGGSEYNYNVGNLRPSNAGLADPGVRGWHGAYITRTHGRYRAYDSLADGTADFLRLLTTSRYNAAYQYLVSTGDVAGFYEQLIRAGYYPADEAEIQTARREYESMYNSMLARNLQYIPPQADGNAALVGAAAGDAGSKVATVLMVVALGAGVALIARALRA